ncbi:hypothetical protein PRK78_000216 [Emydomyces testavorans]|uniref:Calcineurin-like phosphoesterase domain-containing protein n=1 Tax=Emydomyces testavorans TaxID=2070801 RepID=A0AAF0IFL7_9EURO|nr:hypothetical protein PRK78_000216 [Emydomyces testavorans]
MKFQILSDLHLELCKQYHTFSIPTTTAPYLVLAGDIGRLQDYDEYLAFLLPLCNQYMRVFLVLGNHEFYGISRAEGLERATSLEREPSLQGKLSILNRTRYDVPDTNITILGCTLHSQIDADSRESVVRKVQDFRRIQDWSVELHNAEHAADVAWLEEEIESVISGKDDQHDGGVKREKKILVITHHAPTRQESSAPEHVSNPWSSAFATDLLPPENTSLSQLTQVQWWIFGHTHYSTRFSRGKVKLLSNQRGYVFPKNGQGGGLHPPPAAHRHSGVQWIRRVLGLQGDHKTGSEGSITEEFDVSKVIDI